MAERLNKKTAQNKHKLKQEGKQRNYEVPKHHDDDDDDDDESQESSVKQVFGAETM